MKLVIIDTGCANLASVRMAFERLGVTPQVSRDADVIAAADKLVLPGVGTSVAAMRNLNERGLVPLIRAATQPLLGFCLGMQMLAESSEERMGSDADIECLGIIPGKIRLMQVGDLRLPHMGWNQVWHDETHPLLKGIPSGSYFYFVHSYALEVTEATLATCDYGQPFTAIAGRDNFFGAQFHPERSGAVGARLLQNFLEL
ncbi:imidazole glycerol phosphate synthase subunit HisH [Aeromonas simiae]|uniref:Imidazole glycerol phosphate synthase subunit HisH n=1 Tax=Aeromonas simiae TaxID=218936 RepID=A0A5J6WYY2_9GAMM|nr:imidazole glycerol phosphate synthase subunit HisH [Aeromonas simiae]MDO2948018.1 imidazole glycerol phosphate synthase subunit HisH [Aeromonas simiae]MDO2952269.1 imidazole glycerol phosphate synthase subunit HisH [Aeromonas simiae]MDO2955401.1 imidazole glycerol phosphate synthase subunit HisH [Aeromonas simiae]QFI55078.1 imidazole glycerol phosphate synthase subunit HisH [Aeromonas simiae]